MAVLGGHLAVLDGHEVEEVLHVGGCVLIAVGHERCLDAGREGVSMFNKTFIFYFKKRKAMFIFFKRYGLSLKTQ